MSNESYELQPTETYKDMPIFLFQDGNMPPGEYGAMVGWYGRMTPAEVEEWEKPTWQNILRAARGLIDLLKEVDSQGLVDPDGYIKGA